LEVQDDRAETIAFMVIMVALSNLLSTPPFAIPVVIGTPNAIVAFQLLKRLFHSVP
jgi:hypothetical protein